MVSKELIEDLYLKYAYKEAETYINLLKQYEFVKDCYFENGNIRLILNDDYDLENQNIADVFMRGGVIKLRGKDKYENVLPIDLGVFNVISK